MSLTTVKGSIWNSQDNHLGVSVKDFGAVGDGVTDDTAAIQAALDARVPVRLISGDNYGISSELTFSRGSQLIGPGTDFYPTTDQTGSISDKAAVITWIGTTSTGSMLRASKAAVGTAHTDAFNDSLFGCVIQGVVLDGANLVDYGLYGNRIQGGTVVDVVATRTNDHGIYINGAFNSVMGKLMAFKNNGCGISIGRAFDDFGAPWALVQVNACYLYDLWGFSNGLDGTFDETTNPLWGYGVGLWLHRSNFVNGVRAENNDGANFVFRPSSYSNSINQIYSELANSLDIGGGATAISQARASQKWGVWYSPSDAGGYGNAIRYGSVNSEHIRITGTNPSGRSGQPFELEQIGGATGMNADWDDYTLKNCEANLHNTVTGSAARSDSGTENGYIKLPELMPQAAGTFDATAGSITTIDTVNCSISYAGVGLYDVTITDAMDDTNYTVICPAPAANRAVYIASKAVGSFRIGFTNLSAVATDSSAVLSFQVVGRRKA